MTDEPRPPEDSESQPSAYEPPAAEDLPDQPVDTSATVTMF
jgi:hypothetical protein